MTKIVSLLGGYLLANVLVKHILMSLDSGFRTARAITVNAPSPHLHHLSYPQESSKSGIPTKTLESSMDMAARGTMLH